MLDAFLFFVIATVASAAVLAYTALSVAEGDSEARADALAYAEDVRSTLMRTTLDDPWYVDGSGGPVHLGQGITIEMFLLDEVQLLDRGLTRENFSVSNLAIRNVGESLVRPPFVHGVEASIGSGTGRTVLWIGDGEGAPDDRLTASWTYHLNDIDAEIAVHIWYV